MRRHMLLARELEACLIWHQLCSCTTQQLSMHALQDCCRPQIPSESCFDAVPCALKQHMCAVLTEYLQSVDRDHLMRWQSCLQVW